MSLRNYALASGRDPRPPGGGAMLRIGLVFLVLGWFGQAAAVPVNGFQRFSTGAACDRAVTGVVDLGLDVFGSFGSATAIAQDARFNPADDAPDRGARGTVFESMPFLCRRQAGATAGRWLETGRIGNVAARADAVGDVMTSTYTVDGIEVRLEATFECNQLTQCWTFANRTGARLDEVALIHYEIGRASCRERV